MATTITFHNNGDNSGWSSRWSYTPENMVYLNNRFYSFNDGNLYLHDSNPLRGTFYGTIENDIVSQITGVFNMAPTDVKMWKTLEIEGNEAWDVNTVTDLMEGEALASYFEKKEGTFFAFIRNNDESVVDFKSRSTKGLGLYTSVNISVPTAVVVTMPSSMRTIVGVGDKIYKISGTDAVLCGTVTVLGAANVFTIDTTGGSNPEVATPLISVKSNVAESQGVRGYYMKYTMTTSETGEVELFGVNSTIFKSYP